MMMIMTISVMPRRDFSVLKHIQASKHTAIRSLRRKWKKRPTLQFMWTLEVSTVHH